jgi:hypothetical protein
LQKITPLFATLETEAKQRTKKEGRRQPSFQSKQAIFAARVRRGDENIGNLES